MIAKTHSADKSQISQTTQKENNGDQKAYPEVQRLIEAWCRMYEDYLVHDNSQSYFKSKSFFYYEQQKKEPIGEPIAPELPLLQALEDTLVQEIERSASLMAWHFEDQLPWLEEFMIEMIQSYPGRTPLPKSLSWRLLNRTIGVQYHVQHAKNLYDYYCEKKTNHPFERLTNRLSKWGCRWYYPDYLKPHPNIPNETAYGSRLGYVWERQNAHEFCCG